MSFAKQQITTLFPDRLTLKSSSDYNNSSFIAIYRLLMHKIEKVLFYAGCFLTEIVPVPWSCDLSPITFNSYGWGSIVGQCVRLVITQYHEDVCEQVDVKPAVGCGHKWILKKIYVSEKSNWLEFRIGIIVYFEHGIELPGSISHAVSYHFPRYNLFIPEDEWKFIRMIIDCSWGQLWAKYSYKCLQE